MKDVGTYVLKITSKAIENVQRLKEEVTCGNVAKDKRAVQKGFFVVYIIEEDVLYIRCLS